MIVMALQTQEGTQIPSFQFGYSRARAELRWGFDAHCTGMAVWEEIPDLVKS